MSRLVDEKPYGSCEAHRTHARSALFAAAFLVLAACGNNDSGGVRFAALTAVDDVGRTVALEKPAQRIVALAPSLVEIVYAVGCGDKLVLRDLYSDFPAPARALPATDPLRFSVDTVAGFRPDLALTYFSDAGRVAALERIGIPTAIYRPDGFADVFDEMRAIAKLCGGADPEPQIAALERRLDAIARQTAQAQGEKRPAVFVCIDAFDPGKPWTVGAKSFLDDLVKRAGARNLGDAFDRPSFQLSLEAVIAADPDVVLPADVLQSLAPEERTRERVVEILSARPGWSSLRAVREGRVIVDLDVAQLQRPGPRLVDSLEQLAREIRALRGAR